MIPTLPNRFADKSNFDLDAVNESFRSLARVIKIAADRRYTYWQARLDLAGVTNAVVAELRSIAIRGPSANSRIEVIGVEAYVNGNAAVGASVTCDADENFGFEFETSATDEAFGGTDTAILITSNVSDVVFTIAFDAAITVSDGALIVHFRSDRSNQGDGYTRFEPDPSIAGGDWPYSSLTSTADTEFEDTLQNADTSVTEIAAADQDLRCQVFAARNLAPGASIVFTIPGGDGMDNDFRVDVYVVAAATNTGRASINDHTATVNVDVVGTGVASRAHGGAALGRGGGTDPVTAADDTTITLKNQAGAANVLLIYAVVWWD